jgi:hypothetical protein
MPANKRWPGWLDGEQAALERDINREYLGRVAKILREEIVEMGLVDTGKLLRSVKVDEERGTVIMDVPYAEEIEHGRSPGTSPPYDAIRLWVGRKFGLRLRSEEGNQKGSYQRRKMGRSVAFAIMNKIKKTGVPGTHIMERAWKRALE